MSTVIDERGQKPKGIAQRSVEAGLLAARLKTVEVGGLVTYDELSAVIGEPIRTRRGWLATALRVVASEDGIIFDTVRSVGLRRCNDTGKTTKAAASRMRINREAHRGLKILRTIDDVAALNADERTAYNLAATHLGMVHTLTTAKAVERLRTEVVRTQQTLPLAKTLDAMKGN